jgi:hypothetical protein
MNKINIEPGIPIVQNKTALNNLTTGTAEKVE